MKKRPELLSEKQWSVPVPLLPEPKRSKEAAQVDRTLLQLAQEHRSTA
jgi:hypothetical protein